MNSRRRGDSTLLVTFCNVRQAKPLMAAVDLTRAGRGMSWIDMRPGVRIRGARGLCFWDRLLCVAHEPGRKDGVPPGFVFLDPGRDYQPVGHWELPSPPHSVCSHDGRLFFTMSREDAVYRAQPGERLDQWAVSRHWTLPGSSGEQDENHVNAIEVVDNRLCVSATGRKAPDSSLWSSAKRGFVYDTERSAILMDGIRQPHSLLEDRGVAWTCETRGLRLLASNGEERRLPGEHNWRVRGLAIDDGWFYFGVSKNRLGSRSQGTLRGYEGVCRVYRLPRGGGDPELVVDFTADRNEIYELALL